MSAQYLCKRLTTENIIKIYCTYIVRIPTFDLRKCDEKYEWNTLIFTNFTLNQLQKSCLTYFHEFFLEIKFKKSYKTWFHDFSVNTTSDKAQCLSHFFGKNFVKATHLLTSLKNWFDGKKFRQMMSYNCWDESKFFIFPQCALMHACMHHWQKFRESNGFTKEITK